MNVLKSPSIFRPTSRPTSPTTADTNSTADRTSRRMSIGSFRRPSTSVSTFSPLAIPGPLVQDGSYLETLSLKLNEAVSRSLAHPTVPATASEQLGGKQPIPTGRGKALGALIET
jgi:hypothetical protein